MIHWTTPALFALAAIVVFVGGKSRVRRTTFIGPWCWAISALVLAAIGSVYVNDSAGAGQSDNGAFIETLSFGMATLFFCPIVSVLGAKRPQDKAWHLIVGSLWFVLVLPAAESLFVHRSGGIQIHDARAWFLWALIAVALLNYVFTRYVFVVILCCAAVTIWLSPYLPGLRWDWDPPTRTAWASVLLHAAVVLAFVCRGWKTPARHLFDETWIDFRDTFGITWGLRVMERVNTAAEGSRSPARLEWYGFQVGDDITDEQTKNLKASFDGILRRFIDVETFNGDARNG